MVLSNPQRQYVDTARVGRLATVDDQGRPHAVPICYTRLDDQLYTPLDEKPQTVDATELRRVRNIRANPQVTVVVDHYTEQWAALGWVQLRGTASVLSRTAPAHDRAVGALREKYDQYAAQDIDQRPLIRVEIASARSWGRLDRPEE